MKPTIQKFVKTVSLFSLFFSLFSAHAQAPQKMSYQAVVRNAANTLIANTAVGVKISVLQTSASGTVVYSERHTPTTNANGLATFEIGGGTVLSGTMSGINWANGPFFIKTETDPAGGTNYTIAGTSQLASVPYALFAANGGTPGPQGIQGVAGAVGAQGIQGVAGTAGVAGKNSVALTTVEPVGANCPTGGNKLQFGIDANSNNTLDPSEINAVLTKYVCNGATGAQGPAGSATNAWGLSGNAGAATNFIGTTGNNPLVIKANNIEVAKANTNGTMTIGLGNTDPLNVASLGVKGDVVAYDGGKIKVSAFNEIGFFEVLTTTKNSIDATTIDQSNTPEAGTLLINPSGGNIGIGNTGTINNKLQIGNPPGFSGNDIAIGNGTQAMSLSQSPTASIFYTSTNFAFMPAGGVGNVGINTTTPSSKLEVNGSIANKFTLINADYTPTDADYIIYANKQFDVNAPLTITLPPPAFCRGRIYYIKAIGLPYTNFTTQNLSYDVDSVFNSDREPNILSTFGSVTIKNHLNQTITFLHGNKYTSNDPFTGDDVDQSRTFVCVQSIGTSWVVLSDNFFRDKD